MVAGDRDDGGDRRELFERAQAHGQGGRIDEPPIEVVAGHEHRVDLRRARHPGDLGECSPGVVEAVHSVEALADVPIAGMEQPHQPALP